MRRRRASSAAGSRRARRARRTRARASRSRGRRTGAGRARGSRARARRASSASFQAETTSSAVPRTPASQSSAITMLCSASPTTSTCRAQTGRRTRAVLTAGPPPRASCRGRSPGPGTGRARRAPSARAASSTSSKPRARKSRSRVSPSGSQCANGSSVCGSIGNHRFGVVTNTCPATRQSSATKRRCSSRPPATCSTHRVREAEVELAVGERQLAAVRADRVHAAGTRPGTGRARCGRRR